MKKKSVRRWVGFILLIVSAVCLILMLVSVVFNAAIPKESANPGMLALDQKALLAEATHLRQSLGNVVFPGFGDQEIPFVVYNEDYAFYTGEGKPAAGWRMAPYDEVRGGEWEAVPGDDFFGAPYYRSTISDPEKTPESFIVEVGGQLAGSFQTREYGLISMKETMQSELPPVIRSIVPYRLIAGQIFTNPQAYISGLLHESFHAYQGNLNPKMFARSETAGRLEEEYPFEDEALSAAWDEELKVLSQAAGIESIEQARELARQFLALREQRRRLPGLIPEMIEYEQAREWLEGLAKYAELEIGRAAAVRDYEPLPAAVEVAGLQDYLSRERFWRLQLGSIDNTIYNGETLFYYSGFAQGVLLDHLTPDWKELAIQEGAALDELLQQAVDS